MIRQVIFLLKLGHFKYHIMRRELLLTPLFYFDNTDTRRERCLIAARKMEKSRFLYQDPPSPKEEASHHYCVGALALARPTVLSLWLGRMGRPPHWPRCSCHWHRSSWWPYYWAGVEVLTFHETFSATTSEESRRWSLLFPSSGGVRLSLSSPLTP